MHFRTAFIVATVVSFMALSPGVSDAAPGILSPADPLVAVSPDGVTETCTLGFLLSGPDG